MSGPLKVAQDAPPGAIDVEQLKNINLLRQRLADCCGVEASAHKDDFTLLRFLIARNHSLDEAEKMFRGAMEWRESTEVSALFHEWASRSERAKFGDRFFYGSLLPGTSRDDSPLMIERLGVADLAGMQREDIVDSVVLAYIVYLESAFRAVRQASQDLKHLVRAFVVVDAFGVSLSTIWNIGIVKRVASIGPPNYPEVTRRVAIVRGPGLVAKVWSLISPLLPEHTRAKVVLSGGEFKETIEAEIDFQNMPRFLGGDTDDAVVCAAETVPEGAGKEVPVKSIPL